MGGRLVLTIEIEDYSNRVLMKTAKKIRASNGWRALHTDFINNKESDGYQVTYDNTPDPPPLPKRQLTQRQFLDELAAQNNAEII